MDAGRTSGDGTLNAPVVLAEAVASFEAAGYYYGMATGCWPVCWPAGFAALAGTVCWLVAGFGLLLAIPDGFSMPVF